MLEGWRKTSIGQVLRIASGQVDPKNSAAMNLISVGPENLKSGGGIISEGLRSAADLGQISGKYVFDEQAILYSKIRPNLNKAALPTFQGICSADMYPMWVLNELENDRDFLFYIITSERFVAEATARSFRTGLPKINREDLEGIEVTLPPLPEQYRIAAILQTWDEAIEKLDALRTAKAERLKALTFNVVFGSYRLGNFSKGSNLKTYRWFDLPSDWSCEAIGKISKEISERNDSGKHEVLSCTKYAGFVRSLDYFKKQIFSSDLSGYKVIYAGDFGFPSNHVEEGSIGLQNIVDVGLVSPIYTVFRFNSDKVDGDYAYAVLKTSLYKHIFNVSTSASVDRRGSLRWKEFRKIPFPLPPLNEQRAIVQVLQTARDDLAATETEITALKRQKRGLMQKLLTGEWRVGMDDAKTSKIETETTHG